MPTSQRVFLTGGTGYLGRALAIVLVQREHTVRALVRSGSEGRLPAGCTPVMGDALDQHTYAAQVAPMDTFVHLVGVSHPGPSKTEQFRSIDLASIREAIQAATAARVGHFIYISVAHPAPVMTAYWRARVEAESLIKEARLNATILRPWYVLGPGHRWPLALVPVYWLAERIPATRAAARRLGLVTLRQMIAALVWSVEHPATGTRILAVPDIRRGSGA
jgi:nucleoside-diphosphate-sugar epimerase